jgi:hypothetical protein
MLIRGHYLVLAEEGHYEKEGGLEECRKDGTTGEPYIECQC